MSDPKGSAIDKGAGLSEPEGLKTSNDDDKKLLNEILPDPTQAADAARGSPRERTVEHLRKVMAAAAGLAMGAGTALADVTPPPGKDGQAKQGDAAKQGDGKAKDGDAGKTGKQAQKPKQPPPTPPSYGVVDPMPEPYIDKKGKPGFLRLTTKPVGAHILIDGSDGGLKTPQSKISLSPGIHAVTISLPGKVNKNFTVEIRSGETISERYDLEPLPPKPPDPSK
jgi:hypothetical protein